MQKVYVERPRTDETEDAAGLSAFFKPSLVMPEEHHDEQQEAVHRNGARQIGPYRLECVELKDVGTANDGKCHDEREEPRRVEKPFQSAPVTPDDVAKQEELHVPNGLYKAGIVEEHVFVIRKDLRQVERLVGKDTDGPSPEQQDGSMPQYDSSNIAAHIIYNEPLQQDPCEPVAAFRRTCQEAHKVVPEVALHPEYHKETRKHQGRDDLYLELLPCQFQSLWDCPCEVCLVCQETADKEEQRHTEQQAQRHEHRVFRVRVKAETVSVVCHHHEHRKATQGVEPFKTLFIYHRFLAY